jgi:predicted nucleotide-binding protein (sugar kinase/HSP70/actin superfamily)
MKKIGIPRAFYYYHYPLLWETFFRTLNFDAVVSGNTSYLMIEESSRFSESEHCLAHKLFDAHLHSLIGTNLFKSIIT